MDRMEGANIDDIALAGTEEERQMARWIRNLMMRKAICYPMDSPVKHSLPDLVAYFKECNLEMSERELLTLIDSAIQQNPEVWGREEKEVIYYVTSKRRCFPKSVKSHMIRDLVVDLPSQQLPTETTTPQEPPLAVSEDTENTLPSTAGTSKSAVSEPDPEGPPPRRAQFTLTQAALSRGFIKITPGMRKMISHLNLSGIVKFVTYGRFTLKVWLNPKRNRFQGNELRKWLKERHLQAGDKVYLQMADRAGEPLRLGSWQRPSGPDRSEEGKTRLQEHMHLRERVSNALSLTGKVMTMQAITDRLEQELGRPVKYGSVQTTLHRESHIFAAWGQGRWGLREWGEDWRDRVDPQAVLMRIEEEDLVFEVLKRNGFWMSEPAIARQIAAKFLLTSDMVLETSFLDPSDERLERRGNLWGLKEWGKYAIPLLWRQPLKLYPGFPQVVDEWFLKWRGQTAKEFLATSRCYPHGGAKQ